MKDVDKLRIMLDEGIEINRGGGELMAIIAHCEKDEDKISGEIYISGGAEFVSKLIVETLMQIPEVEMLVMQDMLKMKLAAMEVPSHALN